VVFDDEYAKLSIPPSARPFTRKDPVYFAVLEPRKESKKYANDPTRVPPMEVTFTSETFWLDVAKDENKLKVPANVKYSAEPENVIGPRDDESIKTTEIEPLTSSRPSNAMGPGLLRPVIVLEPMVIEPRIVSLGAAEEALVGGLIDTVEICPEVPLPMMLTFPLMVRTDEMINELLEDPEVTSELLKYPRSNGAELLPLTMTVLICPLGPLRSSPPNRAMLVISILEIVPLAAVEASSGWRMLAPAGTPAIVTVPRVEDDAKEIPLETCIKFWITTELMAPDVRTEILMLPLTLRPAALEEMNTEATGIDCEWIRIDPLLVKFDRLNADIPAEPWKLLLLDPWTMIGPVTSSAEELKDNPVTVPP
jgi:hypothetical protein